jgi:hypothetical protein
MRCISFARRCCIGSGGDLPCTKYNQNHTHTQTRGEKQLTRFPARVHPEGDRHADDQGDDEGHDADREQLLDGIGLAARDDGGLEVLDGMVGLAADDGDAGRRRLGGGGLDEILDVSAVCIRHDDYFSRVGPERVCGCEDVVVMGMARDVPLRSEVKIFGLIIVVEVVQVCQKVQHHAGHAQQFELFLLFVLVAARVPS